MTRSLMLTGSPDDLRDRADCARHRLTHHPSQTRRADLLDAEADRLTRARHNQGRAAVRREVTPGYLVRRQARDPHPRDGMTGAQIVAAAIVGGMGWVLGWAYLGYRTRNGEGPHGQRAMLAGLATVVGWVAIAVVVGWPVLWGLAALQLALAPWAYAVLGWLWGWDAFPEWRAFTMDSPASRAPGVQLAEVPRTTADDDGRTPPHVDW